MKLYVDDDHVASLLHRLLVKANHDVVLPAQYGLAGADDSVHLLRAILEHRALISGNHDDYLNLHNLVVQSGGHHAGILIVRRDNDPRRDMSARGIVRAIMNIALAGIDPRDLLIILNHWR
jgi:hypothetical protein